MRVIYLAHPLGAGADREENRRRADEVWMFGGRVSPGMAQEANEARRLGKRVRDFTWMGTLPPEAG